LLVVVVELNMVAVVVLEVLEHLLIQKLLVEEVHLKLLYHLVDQ
tara:strand:- start:479 stop:610 length:132 start_codon:yes stop_codon:yes gene_type:complete